MSLLELNNVSFTDGGKTVLKDVSLSVENGDFVSITGPSGGGKSTFLRLIAHLISPSEGSIKYKNKSVFEYDPVLLRRDISYCFQIPCLFGPKVIDDLSFPFSLRKKEFNESSARILLEMFNLDDSYINKDTLNLSGGEKQRISLVRTLLFEPSVLLLDEITSALDKENASMLLSAVNSLNTDRGVTVLWVTHNQEALAGSAGLFVRIEDGRILSKEELS